MGRYFLRSQLAWRGSFDDHEVLSDFRFLALRLDVVDFEPFEDQLTAVACGLHSITSSDGRRCQGFLLTLLVCIEDRHSMLCSSLVRLTLDVFVCQLVEDQRTRVVG